MKYSILNRIQNSLTRMLIPFIIFSFYGEGLDEFVKYYAIGLALASLIIFGFPLKIGKSLSSQNKNIIESKIYFIYLFFATLFFFTIGAIVWDLSILVFILVGLFFSFNNMHIVFEKYCQYNDFDKDIFIYFLFYNFLLLLFVLIGCLISISIFKFYLYISFLAFMLLVFLIVKFFKPVVLSFLDFKFFFSDSIDLGKYSLMQNFISRGDSLILPYIFSANLFSKYYLITRFIDMGNFLLALFSQLSLVNAYKQGVQPDFYKYLKFGFLAVFFSMVFFVLYSLFFSIKYEFTLLFLFFILLLKSIFLYYQDMFIYNSYEKFLNLSLYFQLFIFVILFLFGEFFISFFNVYFYMVFVFISLVLTNLFLYFLRLRSV